MMEEVSLLAAEEKRVCAQEVLCRSANDSNHRNHRPGKTGARGDAEKEFMWEPFSSTQVHACLSSFLPPNRELIKCLFNAHYHQPFLIASFWECFATASLTV